ncbi:MAG: FAD-dependent oxidoreductase [Casimicrobiaceae bacterium]
MKNVVQSELPVVVIGAGPVGLATAAHLLERGIEPLVLEGGDAIGASLRDFGHVQLFSPWRYNIDAAMARMLRAHGWQEPDPDELPFAIDVVEKVLRPFATLPEVARHLRLQSRVVAVTRDGFDKVKTEGRASAPFVVRLATPVGEVEVRAQAVIDASGTWGTPNPLGANGLPAIGEEEAGAQIHYGVPDVLGSGRSRYLGKRVMVVGAGHSAANALLALAVLAEQDSRTQLLWAVRGTNLTRMFGGGDADALPARGRLGTELRKLEESGRLDLVPDFRISAVSRRDGKLIVHAIGADGTKKRVEGIDEVICATGQRPNLALTSELRTRFDPWLESAEALGPLIDPNLHSCGTVRPHGHRELAHPEPGLYIIGVKSYGRAPTFLMTTGYEQARSVVAAIAGDIEAADRVELVLPETGVCSSNLRDAGGSCCGDESAALVTIDEPAVVPAGDCGPSSCASGSKTSRKAIGIPVKAAGSCC